jgi:nucleoside-diphosphate-sugar epimerase
LINNRKGAIKVNVLILAAYGRIARIVESRILSEARFNNVNLTLVLKDSKRLASLSQNPRVKIIEGDIEDFDVVNQAMQGQDLVYVSNVDITHGNSITVNVIQAMLNNNVKRVISSNAIGIYDEVQGEFGRMNRDAIDYVFTEIVNSENLLVNSGLGYTILRLPWLNSNKEINYTVTTRYQKFYGDYVSRQSVADLVLKIIDNPEYGLNDSLALADPNR